MSIFSNKLNTIASNTNSYLKSFFLKQKSNSYLLQPMKYGVFSGGKRFRSAIVVNTGRIFSIDYKKLIIINNRQNKNIDASLWIQKLILRKNLKSLKY